eukprot:1144174-Pelagomonas_calceolata.AAC.3
MIHWLTLTCRCTIQYQKLLQAHYSRSESWHTGTPHPTAGKKAGTPHPTAGQKADTLAPHPTAGQKAGTLAPHATAGKKAGTFHPTAGQKAGTLAPRPQQVRKLAHWHLILQQARKLTHLILCFIKLLIRRRADPLSFFLQSTHFTTVEKSVKEQLRSTNWIQVLRTCVCEFKVYGTWRSVPPFPQSMQGSASLPLQLSLFVLPHNFVPLTRVAVVCDQEDD